MIVVVVVIVVVVIVVVVVAVVVAAAAAAVVTAVVVVDLEVEPSASKSSSKAWECIISDFVINQSILHNYIQIQPVDLLR